MVAPTPVWAVICRYLAWIEAGLRRVPLKVTNSGPPRWRLVFVCSGDAR
jgi:hypothetical protein